MDEEIQEQAVPFLIYDQNTRVFTLTEQGEEVIRNLNGNFGVIAVAGMYRTGKSYLLNRMLLNRQKGFSVGPTVNPCTKGLWIWSKPIYGTGEDGKRLPLLLIDTEGFGAFDEDQNHDIRIFTLSILLCSYFVYNSLGSIDENAIQSLSFVINLSKYIHLKNNQGLNETDSDNLANLFPSFLWVLRDFSLQLVDENEEQITPKEYLEKVLDLNIQTKDHEQKNRIRKLIKSYFKDRDCFTMVRPLLMEKDLQNLDNSAPDKLRPEFLEQILSLRKKILNRVKVKTFKNQPLTAEMYINLIKSLISSINSGSIPNIENTWVSMCKYECQNSYEESERIYENFIRDFFMTNGATDQASFKSFHNQAKEKAFLNFKLKAIGEIASEYERMLKEKIKEKSNYFMGLNMEENKMNITKKLDKWSSVIEFKIQNGELRSPDEVEMEFKGLEYKLNEEYSLFEEKGELFNKFKSKVLNFASEFFLGKMNQEVDILKQENQQIINKLNSEIKETKTSYENDLNKKNVALEQLKQENQYLKDDINKLKENLAILEKEKDLQIKTIKEKHERVKDDYERKINDLYSKVSLHEEKSKEIERKAITVSAEAEKEKALYEQKIEQLTKQLEDYTKREKESGVELKSQLKEQSIALRETSAKYETQVKNMRNELDALKEKLIDLESHCQEKENKLEFEKNRNDELQGKLNSEKNELNEKMNTIKSKLEAEKNALLKDIKIKGDDFNTKENLLKIKLEEIELKYKVSEEGLKTSLNKLERDSAILKQNNEFLEIQNKDLINKMDEQKKAHEKIIATLESKTFSMVGHEEFQKKVDEIKLYFENDKKQLEESFEKSKLSFIQQIDLLTEKLNESEFKAKIYGEELQKEYTELKSKYDKANKELILLRNEKIQISENMVQSNLDFQQKLKSLSEDYEKKSEEKENKHQKELLELNRASEETINQMKALFETEKIRFEDRLKDEKHKNERKYKNLIDDYEHKLRELENELKDEIEILQNEKDELEIKHNDYVQNSESEISSYKTRMDNIENALKEKQDAYNVLQNQLNMQMEQLNENYTKERKELLNKIENLVVDNNNKEKENVSLSVRRDQLEKLVQEKENSFFNLKKEYEDEKKDMIAKLEEYKKLNNESNDEFMIKKLEYTRVNALLTQQIEFLNKKIEENQVTIENNQKRYEERLFSLRSEVEKDMNEKFERIKKEKEDLESKLLQKKKELRDMEQTFLKQTNSIEKEKTILSEKLSALEEKKREMQENFEKEIEQLNSSIKNSKKDISKEKEELLNNLDSMKKRITILEGELAEKTGSYEKDQILWDGKFKFIEQQRDQYRKDLTESQKRFENLLENMQKKANTDKEKLETAQQSAISSIEQKYLNQIKELQETHQKLYSELINANKELERENKNLNLQAEIKGKSNSDNSALLQQIEELTIERNKYKKDFDDIKNEKDKQHLEHLSNSEKEKMILKLKISEVENKMREVESKRGSLMLEYEKDKAKWSIDRDNLVSKYSELQESYERLEKKNETLLRENEKLKSDKLNNKRSSSKGGAGIASILGARDSLRGESTSNVQKIFTGFLSQHMSGNNSNSNSNSSGGFNFGSSAYNINSQNPYSKDINKILDNSGIENNSSDNNSRIMGEKSIEKIEPKFDPRYDNNLNSKFETFGKHMGVRLSNLNTKPAVTKPLDDDDSGRKNLMETLLNNLKKKNNN